MPSGFDITPDRLLVAWWIVSGVVIAASLLVVVRVRRADRDAVMRSYLVGNPTGRYSMVTARTFLPAPLLYAHVLGIAVLAIGVVATIWLRNETALLHFNFQVLAVVLLAAAALSRFRLPRLMQSNWTPGRIANFLTRWVLTLACAVGSAAIAYALYEDIILPRVAIEGRVDRLLTSRDHYYSPTFTVVIGGRSFETTGEVLSRVKPGDVVRAEALAGSKIVVRVERAKTLPTD